MGQEDDDVLLLATRADNLADFAKLLRLIRSRHARRAADRKLSYRELAAKTGYAHGVIGDYLSGKRLPATDRLDALAYVLGATGEERSALATARDRIEELRRKRADPLGYAVAWRTLPRDIFAFTGRQQELRLLTGETSVPGGDAAILVIGGMAGIGKTALAVHAAHLIASRFPDGQFFVPLSGHSPAQRPADPADVLVQLLQATGLDPQRIPAGLQARSDLWRDQLADRRLVLILDDALSHEQVQPLLPGTAGCLVLITSRRHLTALEGARAISLESLAPADAAELLVRLSGRADLDPADPAVTEICGLCDGLPLAVGLLARQLHHHHGWTAGDLAADLSAAPGQRLELMQAENVSVTAALDRSYADLDPGQQHLFRSLGLQVGLDIDAYAAAALGGVSLAAARRGLAALYDHYLLAEPGHGRYRFHDLIRARAAELAEAGPAVAQAAAVDRLLDYYVHTSCAASRHLARRSSAPTVTAPMAKPSFPAREQAAARMDAEHQNLSTAISFAASQGRPAHAISLANALNGYLLIRGFWSQAVAIHGRAVGAAQAAGDRAGEASALVDLGVAQRLTGEHQAATSSFSQALALCHRGLADQATEAYARNELGVTQYLTADYAGAAGNLTRAIELCRELGDQGLESGALNDLGVVQLAAGQYQAAAASFAQALIMHRELGDPLWEANALNNSGVIERLTGQYQAAAASHAWALDLYRSLGNRFGEARALNYLGVVQCLTGDFAAAQASHELALPLYRALGNEVGEAEALDNLGVVQRLTGRLRAAAASHEHALRLYREHGSHLGEAEALNNQGELALAAGSPAEAAARHRQALGLAEAIPAPLERARALEGIGRSHLVAGEHEQGMARLTDALAIYQDIGSPGAQRIARLVKNS
jgi:tetratricopeptide (TPR) repeat protein/transcriptional regulator with XRE-family HTH domain